MENEISEDLRDLVVERIKTLPSDTMISVGSDKSYSKNELISHVEKNDEIGEKIIQIQLEYLQMMKSGALLDYE